MPNASRWKILHNVFVYVRARATVAVACVGDAAFGYANKPNGIVAKHRPTLSLLEMLRRSGSGPDRDWLTVNWRNDVDYFAHKSGFGSGLTSTSTSWSLARVSA